MDNLEIGQSRGYVSDRLYEFFEDSLRRISLPYVVWLITALLLSTVVYYIWRGSLLDALHLVQFIYYLILLVHIIFRLKKGGRANILAPDIIFVVFYTLFHLGYVTLYSLNIVPYSTYIFHYESSIPKAMFIINIGLIGFLFGFELMGARARTGVQQADTMVPRAGWGTFGIALMTMAISMHFLGLILLGFDVIARYGYEAIQNAYRYTSYIPALFLGQSTDVMTFGLVIYLIFSALRYGKLFHSKIAMGLTIAFFVIVTLEGDRGPLMKFVLPILLVRHYFIKRIKIRYLAVLFCASALLFTGISVVRTIVFQPTKMLKEYKYQKEAKELAWYSAFVEMGASFMVVNITANDVPTQEPYWLGASWRDASIHIVPFLQGYTSRAGISTWGPSTWITITYFGRERAGRAFTVAAEGYLNFGFVGVFAELMFFGLFIRWLVIRFSRKPSAMWALIMFGCLVPSITVVRNHLNLVTNIYMQIIVLGLLLQLFFGNEPVFEADIEAEESNIADSESII